MNVPPFTHPPVTESNVCNVKLNCGFWLVSFAAVFWHSFTWHPKKRLRRRLGFGGIEKILTFSGVKFRHKGSPDVYHYLNHATMELNLLFFFLNRREIAWARRSKSHARSREIKRVTFLFCLIRLQQTTLKRYLLWEFAMTNLIKRTLLANEYEVEFLVEWSGSCSVMKLLLHLTFFCRGSFISTT